MTAGAITALTCRKLIYWSK